MSLSIDIDFNVISHCQMFKCNMKSMVDCGHISKQCKVVLLSYRKYHKVYFLEVEPYRLPLLSWVSTFFFLPVVLPSCTFASQYLFFLGFVRVIFVASGKVAPAYELMLLCSALKTWRGYEGKEVTSSEEMVCFSTFISLLVFFLLYL